MRGISLIIGVLLFSFTVRATKADTSKASVIDASKNPDAKQIAGLFLNATFKKLLPCASEQEKAGHPGPKGETYCFCKYRKELTSTVSEIRSLRAKHPAWEGKAIEIEGWKVNPEGLAGLEEELGKTAKGCTPALRAKIAKDVAAHPEPVATTKPAPKPEPKLPELQIGNSADGRALFHLSDEISDRMDPCFFHNFGTKPRAEVRADCACKNRKAFLPIWKKRRALRAKHPEWKGKFLRARFTSRTEVVDWGMSSKQLEAFDAAMKKCAPK